ncbi:TonB-dependent receptor [Myxococcota bacterium]|nr:TonB-dependent receptor [Myxococcota bacterium]
MNRVAKRVMASFCFGIAALSQAHADPGKPAEEVERITVRGTPMSPGQFDATPEETETLSREVIQTIPATDVADIVRNLPGIRIQQRIQGQGAAVSIEGLPPSYTALRVDGERYSGTPGGVDDLRDLPLINVEKLVVQRGPHALRYGPEAGGGVINLVTRPPPLGDKRLTAEFGGGNDAHGQARATTGMGSETFGASVSVEYDHIAGFDAPTNASVQTPNFFTSDSSRQATDVYARSRWLPGESLTVESRAGWRLRRDDFSSDLARTNERWLAGSSLEWEPVDSTRVGTGLNYYRTRTDSTVGREFELTDDELKFDFLLEYAFQLGGVEQLAAAGVDIRRQSLSLRESPTDLGTADPLLSNPGIVDEAIYQGGLFFIGESNFEPWLRAEYGLRVQFHTEYSAKLIPQVALLVTPLRWGEGNEVRLRFSVGRNHRVPSLREIYQPPTPNAGNLYFLAGNPDLLPESSTSYRASLEIDPTDWLYASVVAFHNDIKDHIRSSFSGEFVLLPTGDPPIPANPQLCLLGLTAYCEDQIFLRPASIYRKQNLDSVTTRGFEARISINPMDWVSLHLGYTYLDTKVNVSNSQFDELPNEAPHVVDARLTLTSPWSDTVLTSRALWRSSAPIEESGTGLLGFVIPDQRSDPSTTLDFRLLQPIGFNSSVYVDLRNATDNRAVDSYVVRGRTFFVGARTEFF